MDAKMVREQSIDLRQSEEYAKYMQRRGWIVENVKIQSSNVKIFIRKIPLIGSVIKIQRPDTIPPEEGLDKLAKKYRAFFIKIEPFDSARDRQGRPTITSYVPDNWPLLPSKTLRLDLTKPEEELWKNLGPDAKYSIRKARKQLSILRLQPAGETSAGETRPIPQPSRLDLPVRQAGPKKPRRFSSGGLGNAEAEKQDRLQQFHKLLKQVGGRKSFYTPKWEDFKTKVGCFGEKAWLVLAVPKETEGKAGEEKSQAFKTFPKPGFGESPAFTGNKPLAGCLLLVHDGVTYYHHAASSEEGRKLLGAYLVLWEAIKLAKTLGCHTFDFEGIYDKRFPKATRKWKGFTFFKKKFGGKEVELPRPLIKYYSLPIKLLFKFFG